MTDLKNKNKRGVDIENLTIGKNLEKMQVVSR